MRDKQGSHSIRSMLAVKIRTLRKKCGMTQEELSSITGITRSHISAVEHGHCNIRIDSIDKIARALGVSIRQLLDDQEADDTKEHPASPQIKEDMGRYSLPVTTSRAGGWQGLMV